MPPGSPASGRPNPEPIIGGASRQKLAYIKRRKNDRFRLTNVKAEHAPEAPNALGPASKSASRQTLIPLPDVLALLG
jgi:hypothetical protein